MDVYAITLSPKTVKRYGHGETILSLVYPGRATISILPVIPHSGGGASHVHV